jgi:hypothetical protein
LIIAGIVWVFPPNRHTIPFGTVNAETVALGVGVELGQGVDVAVGVAIGVEVTVGVGVNVAEAVTVGVGVGVGVHVAVGVGVGERHGTVAEGEAVGVGERLPIALQSVTNNPTPNGQSANAIIGNRDNFIGLWLELDW